MSVVEAPVTEDTAARLAEIAAEAGTLAERKADLERQATERGQRLERLQGEKTALLSRSARGQDVEKELASVRKTIVELQLEAGDDAERLAMVDDLIAQNGTARRAAQVEQMREHCRAAAVAAEEEWRRTVEAEKAFMDHLNTLAEACERVTVLGVNITNAQGYPPSAPRTFADLRMFAREIEIKFQNFRPPAASQ